MNRSLLKKEDLYDWTEDNFIFGVCRAKDLGKIKVRCAVKKYEAGRNPKSILPSAQTIVLVGNVITKEMDVCKKGILGDDFPSYKEARKRANEIKKVLHKNGYQAKTTVGISIKNACVLCGLGVYGKNALIVHPGFGTKVRYAAVVTNWVPEEYDTPLENFAPCESCDACIKACKHNCLTPYVVDGPKCACVYIEKGQKLDQELPMCSDCQDVCPYNQ